MAENVTLARPYAEAVFALAREAGALETWSGLLGRLADVVADAQVQACFGNPLLSSQQITRLLVESTGLEVSAEADNFVQLLVENDRAQVLPEIRTMFEELRSEHEGVRNAVVSSAFPIEADALATLTSDIEAFFKSKVRVSVVLAPELIGGVRIAVGDEVIDASVRGKLDSLAAALQN
ncbi:MAG: F0F1 ATP synthase subunit delta [Candidatus Dactylopiibacterium sp.]|nr:F0F1 ATP synthase subunit delta [Candidatus Dactylopiibacterium sp.]